MDKSLSQSQNAVTATRSTVNANDPKKSPWIDAWRDAVIGVKAYSQCIQLSDLRGDGDHKLLAGSTNKKIIAYKGANLDWDAVIPDNPIAIATFYSETSKIRNLFSLNS